MKKSLMALVACIVAFLLAGCTDDRKGGTFYHTYVLVMTVANTEKPKDSSAPPSTTNAPSSAPDGIVAYECTKDCGPGDLDFEKIFHVEDIGSGNFEQMMISTRWQQPNLAEAQK